MGQLLNRLGELFWKHPAVSIVVAAAGILGFGFLFLRARSRWDRRGGKTAARVALSLALMGGMLGTPIGVGAVAFASKNHCATIAGSQQYVHERCWGAGGD